ncbi:DedA family protein [Corynebacterium breve]|uniref:DedA family protein n=1 Tax=Corynebacterium breve TaxID=3049799 RepID=A0ABY8VE71_9CORY|nr:DedA family protein [Corynebacterium breve]WIM67951.1 DedA family protein [Corynebacterium breve]
MADQIVMWLEQLMTMPIFYPLVSLLIVLDALVPLVPSETVLNLAGAFAGSTGVPNVWAVIFFAASGAIIGDNICYILGTRLVKVVNRFDSETKAGQAVVWVRRNMRRRAGVTIIVARFIPWARWVATIILGSVRYPWFAFFIYDTIGVIVWAFQTVLIGYAGGALFRDNPLLGMVVGVLLGTFVGFLIQRAQTRLFEWSDERRGYSSI